MQHYPLSAYPWRPAEWHENEDRDWGPYRWPQGTPASMRTSVYTADGTEVSVRTELAPLFRALHILSEEVYGYPLHTASGGYTGGYDNRPIAGTSTASSHSRATTADYRAVDNPQSWTFTSTWPPELVYHWTRAGFYWGGYYRGARYDAMHQAYGLRKADVAASFAYVKGVLAQHSIAIRDDGNKIEGHKGGGSSAPTPPKPAPAPAPAPAPKPAPAPPAAGRPDNAVIVLSGLSVRRLQIATIAAGAPHIAVDGVIGKATTGNVDWVQRYGGVDTDRRVGKDTWAALARLVAGHYPLPSDQVFGTVDKRLGGVSWAKRTRSGDRRYDNDTIRYWVRLIQWAEQERGWAPGGPAGKTGSGVWADGVYGEPTDGSTQIAQRALGLTVDGMVGRDTWSALLAGRI